MYPELYHRFGGHILSPNNPLNSLRTSEFGELIKFQCAMYNRSIEYHIIEYHKMLLTENPEKAIVMALFKSVVNIHSHPVLREPSIVPPLASYLEFTTNVLTSFEGQLLGKPRNVLHPILTLPLYTCDPRSCCRRMESFPGSCSLAGV